MNACRAARRADLDALKALWAEVFGDSKEYIQAFFDALYSHVAVAVDCGAVAGMCALLPCELCRPGGAAVPAVYLYALATDPARRGRGHARRLLAWAECEAARRGARAIVTVPASDALRGFYAAAGYEPAFSRRVVAIDAPGVAPDAEPGVFALSPGEYAAARAGFLKDLCYVNHFAPLLGFWAGFGRLIRLESGGRVALAAVESALCGAAVVGELLAARRDEPWALDALAKALPGLRLRVCLPPDGRGDEGFGMLRALGELPPISGGYLAFALD